MAPDDVNITLYIIICCWVLFFSISLCKTPGTSYIHTAPAPITIPTGKAVVEKTDEGSALDIVLHPLVIINVSDHFTRAKVSGVSAAGAQDAGGSSSRQGPPPGPPRVIGALLGEQSGRRVEVFNSFELTYTLLDGVVVIDTVYLTNKLEQFKQVFKTYDLLGWYSTGTEPALRDLLTHKSLLELNEAPLYMMMDTSINPSHKDLPVTFYESEYHVVKGEPTMMFSKSEYKIETTESERISVDHIAKIGGAGGDASALSTHITGLHSAVKMLSSRLVVVRDFLVATKAGKVPKDHQILRAVASLANRLPALSTPQFQKDFLAEYNDAVLVAYLAHMTSTTNAMSELIDKFNVTHEKGARRRPAAF